jgi:hypothetical protein
MDTPMRAKCIRVKCAGEEPPTPQPTHPRKRVAESPTPKLRCMFQFETNPTTFSALAKEPLCDKRVLKSLRGTLKICELCERTSRTQPQTRKRVAEPETPKPQKIYFLDLSGSNSYGRNLKKVQDVSKRILKEMAEDKYDVKVFGFAEKLSELHEIDLEAFVQIGQKAIESLTNSKIGILGHATTNATPILQKFEEIVRHGSGWGETKEIVIITDLEFQDTAKFIQ